MLKHSFLTGFLCFIFAEGLHAQEKKEEHSTYVKANALFLPIGVLNAGIEHQIKNKITVQGDIFISPWKSFAGHEFQYYSFSVEGRYYFDEAFKHWYIGANLSAASFVLQKWNYWSDAVHINSNGEEFIKSNLYQKGFSYLLGITAGYQFKLGENWNMDVYATVGTSQDFYKGYDRSTGVRYDPAYRYNKSGEILPYRGGIMISYKLK